MTLSEGQPQKKLSSDEEIQEANNFYKKSKLANNSQASAKPQEFESSSVEESVGIGRFRNLGSRERTRKIGSIGVAVIAVCCTLAIVFLVFGISGLVTDHFWSVAGETVRNLSGVIVVAGAWIAWVTNKSRSQEAEKADFRDRMRWAVENLDSDNNTMFRYSGAIIKNYLRKREDTWLSREDIIFIDEINENYDSSKEIRSALIGTFNSYIDYEENKLKEIIEKSEELTESFSVKKTEAELKYLSRVSMYPIRAKEEYIRELREIRESFISRKEK